jgi:hypothetical protein
MTKAENAPTCAPANTQQLAADIRAAVHHMREIERRMRTEGDALNDAHGQILARIDELARQIPRPVESYADLIMLADVVYSYDDKADDGTLEDLHSGMPDQRARALLVEAVHHLAGVRYR